MRQVSRDQGGHFGWDTKGSLSTTPLTRRKTESAIAGFTCDLSAPALYRRPAWRRKNDSKGRKAMCAMSKFLQGDAEKQGERSQQ